MNKESKTRNKKRYRCVNGNEIAKFNDVMLPQDIQNDQPTSSISLYRDIAYLGSIGRKREKYCQRYQKFKQRLIDEINKAQTAFASMKQQAISCHKGCAFCCSQLIQAYLGECELIVFYLYQNEEILNTFIKAYPFWLDQVNKNQVIINRVKVAQRNALDVV
jgi:hypothetical protein